MLQKETEKYLNILPKMLQKETKKDLNILLKMLQEETKRHVSKRDDKSRTFAPSDNTTGPSHLEHINESLSRLKNPNDRTYSFDELTFDKIKRPPDFKMDKFLKNKYERIDLNSVNSLIGVINSEITEVDNIVKLGNNKEIYFRDLTNFLYDIKDGKINDFNKEIEYEKRLKNTEKKLANKTEFSKFTRFYEKYINMLKKILFDDTKLSGKGLNISSLPILLSKIYTSNSSKELINNIKQLINNLYDNKQITEQVYNVLNKAITYK